MTIAYPEGMKVRYYTYKLAINGVDVSKFVPYVGPGSVHNYEINKGEIYMNYKIYNSIFNTNYCITY